MTIPKGPGRQPPRGKPQTPRVPTPGEILAAAQAAVVAAQAAAGDAFDSAQLTATQAFDTAVRLPPASMQLAAQLPDLIENLTVAVERLNSTIDRLDRTLTLAEPALIAYDKLLTRLETLSAAGGEAVSRLEKLPGLSLLGRLTGLTREDPDPEPPPSRPRRIK
ncbi:hypothetical protein [Nocardia acidivorans]|uniref:hypothetical protein n=1 Tax=Nocardia acidivorans TaxID=404580 RepID=UPI00083408C1|nr:hypothetical protein [Nocardia acidivorans]